MIQCQGKVVIPCSDISQSTIIKCRRAATNLVEFINPHDKLTYLLMLCDSCKKQMETMVPVQDITEESYEPEKTNSL